MIAFVENIRYPSEWCYSVFICGFNGLKFFMLTALRRRLILLIQIFQIRLGIWLLKPIFEGFFGKIQFSNDLWISLLLLQKRVRNQHLIPFLFYNHFFYFLLETQLFKFNFFNVQFLLDELVDIWKFLHDGFLSWQLYHYNRLSIVLFQVVIKLMFDIVVKNDFSGFIDQNIVYTELEAPDFVFMEEIDDFD